jgi:Ca2+-binding EF-hand superfamily protein
MATTDTPSPAPDGSKPEQPERKPLLRGFPTDYTDPNTVTFAAGITPAAERKLRRMVSDHKGKGLSSAELAAAFAQLGHHVSSPELAAELLRLLDASGDRLVDLPELIQALADVQAARVSFHNMDRHGRGYISMVTVTNCLWHAHEPAVRDVARGTAKTREELAALVEAYDVGRNGVMDLDEFTAMYIDLKHGRMSEARERGEAAREHIAKSVHAWSEFEWLADELGLGLRTKPHADAAPTWTKFAVAGLGGATGWLAVHPLDVAKTRAQLAGKGGAGLFGTLRSVFAKEGIAGLHGGLSAALTRQFTYTTARIGLYDVLRDAGKASLPPGAVDDGTASGFAFKLGCGLAAGGIAAAASCPVEVSLVRMQADGLAPPDQRRNYRHIGHALYSMIAEVGLRVPACTRCHACGRALSRAHGHARQRVTRLPLGASRPGPVPGALGLCPRALGSCPHALARGPGPWAGHPSMPSAF